MEALSVFDMFKIGVGPSSSHTLGPWRAVQRWIAELTVDLAGRGGLGAVESLQIHLYGSLALTGRGHATDQAVCLALLGADPVTVDVAAIPAMIASLETLRLLHLDTMTSVAFDPAVDIVFHEMERLPGHANGMVCSARVGDEQIDATYYSVGGGFVVREGDDPSRTIGAPPLPYPAQVPAEMREHCLAADCRLADMVRRNERAWRDDPEIRAGLLDIWAVMRDGIFRGCHTTGLLPGGLDVKRRAAMLASRLLGDDDDGAGAGNHAGAGGDVGGGRGGAADVDAWIETIRARSFRFAEVLQWVSAFAMAVNEENASVGRVVTAPTNGAAGVIPAVLMYHVCFADHVVTDDEIVDFLLVAGEVGTFFKKGATISAAMGGCQAEIGVSSAMAAAALAEAQGGTVDQAFMAAEIAMEHHLGLTCDPVGGLVQVPCIERNTMGAVKAINAAELAIAGDPADARVSLGEVISTMRATAEDMSDRYKETSQGGLAVNVSVRFTEC